MTETNNIERELGWEDEISNDGPDFTVLPAGDYPFTVVNFERERYTPKAGSKLPACSMAIVEIRIDGGSLGSTTVKHRLYLHTRTEGLLCAFFTGIGQRQHGDKLKMNWSTVNGSTGTAKVGIRDWVSDKGEPMQSNEIKKFYEPKAAAASYTPGAF